MKHLNFYLIIALILLNINLASAELLISNPNEACAILNNHGLQTRSWHNDYDNEYFCSSPYKDIGTGFPLANNIAFYVEGTNNIPKLTKLVINVNNVSASKDIHEELLKMSKELCKRQTGQTLSKPIIDAIVNGTNLSIGLEKAFINVERIDWPTNKGYEIKVIIR
jgi:hypothetical protein